MIARYMLYSGPNILIILEEKDHGNFERVTPFLPLPPTLCKNIQTSKAGGLACPVYLHPHNWSIVTTNPL